MHGGAAGSGAPKGERNGNYRHGFYTAEAIAERRGLKLSFVSLRGSAAESGNSLKHQFISILPLGPSSKR